MKLGFENTGTMIEELKATMERMANIETKVFETINLYKKEVK